MIIINEKRRNNTWSYGRQQQSFEMSNAVFYFSWIRLSIWKMNNSVSFSRKLLLHNAHREPKDWLFAWKPSGSTWLLALMVCVSLQGQTLSHTVTSQHSSSKVEGLRAATPYAVQVRARTVAGYGRYSNPMDFSTSLHSTDSPPPPLQPVLDDLLLQFS